MIRVHVCMNCNDVWAVSTKITSYLWDGHRAMYHHSNTVFGDFVCLFLVTSFLPVTFGDDSEYIKTDWNQSGRVILRSLFKSPNFKLTLKPFTDLPCLF